MRKVALDLSVRKISFCEVANGSVVARRTVSSLTALDDVLGDESEPAEVAIEACREAWHMTATLEQRGHRVLLVDTTRARQLGIGQHGKKTDRIDAEVLARAVERGAIPLAHLLSPARQTLRKELSIRRALVETRAQYVVTIRGVLRAEGVCVRSCDTSNFVDVVARTPMSDNARATVSPLLAVLGTLGLQLVGVDARLDGLCAQEPTIAALTTAPGVGLIVAASFVSVIDEAKRFRSAHEVEAYLGLVPREDSSGDKRRIGSITKQGNSYARAMLVQAAWTLMRSAEKDDPLRAWADAVATRRGKRIAVIAVARRLAGVLFAMWRDGSVYESALVGAASARGLRRNAQAETVRATAMQRAADKMKKRTAVRSRKERSLEASP